MSRPEQNGRLVWSQRLLTFEDLRSRLAGLRELILDPSTLVSPLVLDELRDRKIAVRRAGAAGARSDKASGVGVAVENGDATVAAAMEALKREGLRILPWRPQGKTLAAWAWSLGHLVKEQGRGVAFVSDAALVACIAGKVCGVRPALVASALQAARAVSGFGANLLTVETPDRTFFEVKQILRTAATTACQSSGEIERIFQELDGHAHR